MTPPKNKPAAPDTSGFERVQKVLSRCGIASRRQSEELIKQGRVTVNGKVATLGDRVKSGEDELRLDGEIVRVTLPTIVLVLNKPVGTLCSESDPEGRRLVHHLVPRDAALRLVGRLDFNTEGVLLLTNDGELGNRLSHPRHGVLRVYEARVRGIPSDETIARLVRGVMLDDGPARVESASISKRTDKNAWVQLTLTEGRNREVRRLMERVGHPVMRLRRIRFAGIGLDGLKPAQWRTLTEAEIEDLRARGHVGAFELPPDPRGPATKRRRPAPGKSRGKEKSKGRGDRNVEPSGRSGSGKRTRQSPRKPRGKGRKR